MGRLVKVHQGSGDPGCCDREGEERAAERKGEGKPCQERAWYDVLPRERGHRVFDHNVN